MLEPDLGLHLAEDTTNQRRRTTQTQEKVKSSVVLVLERIGLVMHVLSLAGNLRNGAESKFDPSAPSLRLDNALGLNYWQAAGKYARIYLLLN